MIFELVQDYAAVLETIPDDHPRRRILQLLDEAIRRDVHFVERHPTTLFQCMWNTCWWYDCPEAAGHYVEPEGGWKQLPPWEQAGPKLWQLLEAWLAARQSATPGFRWVRSLRPPPVHLGTAIRAILRHPMQEKVITSTYTPDGRRIVSASWWKDAVRVWDAATGQEVLCIHVRDGQGQPDSLCDLALFPDSRRIVTAANSVRIWDLDTGQELLCLHCEPPSHLVPGVVCSPDGRRIVTAHSREMRVWDADTGRLLRRLAGRDNFDNALAFLPDSRRIVCGLDDHTVRVWDVETGTERLCLHGHQERVLSVAVSPCGRHIVSGSDDHTVRVWDVECGAERLCLCGHDDMVMGVACSPDGRRIASSSWDKTVRVWDMESGAELFRLRGHTSDVRSVAYSPDGRHIVSASTDDTVRVWNAAGGRELHRLCGHESHIGGHISCIALSPEGRKVISGSFDHSVRVWDTTRGLQVLCLRGHARHVGQVSWSADSRRILSGDDGGTLLVWDAQRGCVRCRIRYGGRYCNFALSPDGKRVASHSWDPPPIGSPPDSPGLPRVRVWDVENGTELRCFRGHEEQIYCVAFSPDGKRVASASFDRTVRVWDTDRDVELLRFGNDSAMSAVAYSPDGQQIVTGSWDRTVRVWHAETGAQLRCLQGHEGYVTRVAFSPDGRRIVSAEDDKAARVWDAATRDCLGVIKGTVDIDALALGAAGFRCRILFNDPQTILEDARTGTPVAWFPVPLAHIATMPSGRVWAGGMEEHLCLFTLDGEPAP